MGATLYCGMCSRMRQDVSYSIDHGGYICNQCDLELYEAYRLATRERTLTWGGWQ